MRRRETTAAFFLHLIFILVFVWTIDFPVDILYVKGRPWKYCWYVLYWHLCKRITKNTQACKDVEANEMCTFQKNAPRMPQVWSRCCLSCPVCLISKQPVTDGQQARQTIGRALSDDTGAAHLLTRWVLFILCWEESFIWKEKYTKYINSCSQGDMKRRFTEDLEITGIISIIILS